MKSVRDKIVDDLKNKVDYKLNSFVYSKVDYELHDPIWIKIILKFLYNNNIFNEHVSKYNDT